MSHLTPTPRHPLVECADVLEKALATVIGVDPAWLGLDEKEDLLRRYTTLSSQVEALRLRVLAAADDVALEHGHRRAADWVAKETRAATPVAHAQQTLAEALDTRWTRLGEAVADGRVHLDQARVIVKALDKLPPEVGTQVRADAEAELIGYADRFGPRELARLGARILVIVAPEIGEEHDRKALERAEARAEAATRLHFKTRGDGATDLTATLPDPDAARLKTYLEAFTSPRQRDAAGGWTDPATGQRFSAERLRGEAFRELICGLDPASLPQHGGMATSVFVTTTLETLTTGLGTAALTTGEPLTASQARRMACGAGLIPAVLGTRSEVLDLGRTARLHTPAQRKARLLEHPECQADGCTVPAAWTESHHRHPWSRGGRTDQHNHVLLCGFHHRCAHNPRFHTDYHPDGAVTFHRRT